MAATRFIGAHHRIARMAAQFGAARRERSTM
jgi:hypothetical protein